MCLSSSKIYVRKVLFPRTMGQFDRTLEKLGAKLENPGNMNRTLADANPSNPKRRPFRVFRNHTAKPKQHVFS
jgi:hypothetical protein